MDSAINLKTEMYLMGFYEGKFKADENLSKLQIIIDNITNGKLKNGFFLNKKYEASLDLSPNAYSYDTIFMDIIRKNKIHEIVNDATGEELHLAHIQLRISYPSPRGSYAPWHRDTHAYNKRQVVGNIPPAYKLIYYPRLDQKPTGQMALIPKSHNFIFSSKAVDMGYSRLARKKIIESDNSKFTLFNTALLHKAMNTKCPVGSPRLIYSFVRKNQISEYSTEVFDAFKKLI